MLESNNEKYNSVIKIGLLGYNNNNSSITFELICAKVQLDSNGSQSTKKHSFVSNW